MNNLFPEDDLYGQVFMDYFQGKLKGEAFLVRDDGSRDLFEVKSYFGSFESFAPVEKELLQSAQPNNILDVGCGAGRFALYFQKLGWNVTAVDNSPLISKIAKLCGVKNIINKDIEKIDLPSEYFNTILLLGNNIGIGGTLDGAKRLLQKLFYASAKSGRVLLTSLNLSRTKEKLHLSYQEKRHKEGKYIGEIRLRAEYDDKIGNWFPWLLVESKELTSIAQETGWNIIKLMDEYFYGMVLEKKK